MVRIADKKREDWQLLAIFALFFIQQIQFTKNSMRNNFAQTLPFPKRDKDFTHMGPNDSRKNHDSSIDQITKKSILYADHSILKTELTSSFKTHATINHQETQQKKINTFRSIQSSLRVPKFNPFLGKEKKQQPPKIDKSPQKPNVAQKPHHLNYSKTLVGVPMRSTLKTLLQTKGLGSLQRSFKKSTSRVQSPNIQVNNCISISKGIGQSETGGRSLKLLQKQNQILREENELLKCEMIEIKKNLLSVASYKKEEAITNLRDTIKKEDSEIKELKIKLQISNKKVLTLKTLLQNKDEEIEFLSNKIIQLQSQIVGLKECNTEKIEYLKSKMTTVVRGYAQLEQKFNSEQQEWITFTEKWMEEKNMYLYRISFLQSYISSNQ